MMPAPLEVQDIAVTYPGAREPALTLDNWRVPQGVLCAIVGPNGAGKSTLLKAVMGLVPAQGHVRFYGQTLENARKRIAYMPQRNEVDWQFPVRVADVVAMGFYPRLGLFGRLQPHHKKQVQSILSLIEMQDFARKPLYALSGGQQQRVFLGRALAQEADLLLMDEPMAGIDARTQDICLEIFKRLKDQGKTLIVVHHDLATVTKHFDEVLLLGGARVARGPTAQVMTLGNIQAAYGIPDLCAASAS